MISILSIPPLFSFSFPFLHLPYTSIPILSRIDDRLATGVMFYLFFLKSPSFISPPSPSPFLSLFLLFLGDFISSVAKPQMLKRMTTTVEEEIRGGGKDGET